MNVVGQATMEWITLINISRPPSLPVLGWRQLQGMDRLAPHFGRSWYMSMTVSCDLDVEE
jgi:hypothetical protein